CLTSLVFFFTPTHGSATSPLSLHDALPISTAAAASRICWSRTTSAVRSCSSSSAAATLPRKIVKTVLNIWSLPVMSIAHESLVRSEEHTSELQSRENLVCRLLLEKKKYDTR